jgi:hypothetical protein
VLRVATERSGLALAGETVLVRRDGDKAAFINDCGAPPEPDGASTSRCPTRRPRAALRGESGSGLMRDYAGVEVISSWRHLPALDWGMAVNLDAAEAFAPAHALRDRLLVALGLAWCWRWRWGCC